MSAAVSVDDNPGTDNRNTRRIGRHRRKVTARVRLGRAADAVGRLGSFVTLAALLVLAATAGGLVDGMPVSGDTAVTVTFDGH